jgi:hypothetical protein
MREISRLCTEKVVPEATPGYPWCKLGRTNAELLAQHYDMISKVTLERVRKLMRNDATKFGAQELVKEGFCDPVRLFVKNEPHSREKISSGRYRLISSVSLVDQLVTRLFSEQQNQLEIQNWSRIPSQPGISLNIRSAQLAFNQTINSHGQFADSDMTGWDWSVADFELNAEARSRLQLMSPTPPLEMVRLVKGSYHCLANSVFVLSDGRMYKLTHPGVMKSGSYNTSSSNSRIRAVAAHFVGSKFSKTMGDDCVEQANFRDYEEARSAYLKLGHKLKSYNVHRTGEPYEFCSHIFDVGAVPRVYPTDASVAKMTFRLLNKEFSPQELAQYVMEMRDHPQLDSILDVLGQIGWNLPNNGQEADHYQAGLQEEGPEGRQ